MIGIIDSGYGGLSVVSEIIRQGKKIPFVYLGDNARNPYGIKTKAEILKNTQEMIDYLLVNYDIKILLIACNTICAAALPELYKIYPQLHIEAITNYGSAVARMSFQQYVTVLATTFTIDSNLYQNLIHTYDEKIHVQQLNAQEFVTMVETGKVDTMELQKVLRKINPQTDTLILGCTHFPFLYKYIRELVADSIQIIDPAISFVASCDYEPIQEWQSNSLYLTTGDLQAFTNFIETYDLEKELPIKQIKL